MRVETTLRYSRDIVRIITDVNVSEYELKKDNSESIEYSFEYIELERNDGSVIVIDEDELEYLVSDSDLLKIESEILEQYRSM